MPKILCVSDLHIEFMRDGAKGLAHELILAGSPDTILILAGDIGLLHDSVVLKYFLSLLAAHYKDVIFINGNHEFASVTIPEGLKIFKQIGEDLGIHCLDNEAITIQGQRFLAGTMWYPLPKDPAGVWMFYKDMYDGRCILKDPSSKALIEEVHIEFLKTQQFLEDNLCSDDIVITHHLPSNECVTPFFKKSPLNIFFVARGIDKLLIERQPKIWFHGHTHNSIDINIGNTRIKCNPFGYINRSNRTFNTDIIEI